MLGVGGGGGGHGRVEGWSVFRTGDVDFDN